MSSALRRKSLQVTPICPAICTTAARPSAAATDGLSMTRSPWVISGAIEAPIDKQGRILVPQYLREHAHLEREVTIAGVGLTVEIWDEARLHVNLNQTQASFRSIALVMAKKAGS